ncbi:hypothetical protein BGZ61DRAFT_587113 [Ilyonectria robusta]|uniref:uncharacterized protein n=1 Tax=Ilyonectria robusta TaxID=1079257 RepID=UPI001E8E491D|nr:uncharacterized protein BGZ61DRAFT_587113 [Ilyonectria robusta]KAH8714330.1 hypothetical protein BGZ61DRAFT_587113 [Ilyonectria robusta]
MASDAESDSHEYGVPKDKLSQTPAQQPAAGESWRPGRSPANVELNLGLQMHQRQRALRSAGQDASAPRPEPVGPHSPEHLSPPWTRPTIPDEGEPLRRTRRPIPSDWKPPLAVGASLGEGLSRLEQADRLVAQWEAILRNARETQTFADLSSFERQLEKVTRERDELDESEENLVPVEELESTKRDRIEGRIKVLKGALERCASQAGKVNIQAAIDAYEDGRILCWDKWTLVYAGSVVDYCPTYESFTVDRDKRLDRYFLDHGLGWLWFEAPLAPAGNTQPGHLLAATWAQPSSKKAKCWNGASDGWNITMGFRRVRAFHSRLIEPESAQPDLGQFGGSLAKNKTSQGKVLPVTPTHAGFSKKQMEGLQRRGHDDPDGPRCFFLMHLDSGASVPSLHETDLTMLGIDLCAYPPQTEMSMATANGIIEMPMLEMRVDVCQHDGTPLVGDNPVWPRERHELGGIVPVTVMPGSDVLIEGDSGGLTAKVLEKRRQQGEDVSQKALAGRGKAYAEMRLSGMLPFQVCYSACAPGLTPWFGEDRRDVLGADRMPGQRRNEWHKGILSQEAPVEVEITERPRLIVFEHELGHARRLRDVDVLGRPGASITTLIDGSDIKSFLVEPRRLP